MEILAVVLTEGPSSSGLGAIFENLPALSGKGTLGLLYLISVAGWGLIFYKLLSFHRVQEADREFLARLRRARSCLEVYEEGYGKNPSICQEIYDRGAQAVACQLLGTKDGTSASLQALGGAVAVDEDQLLAIEAGFQEGERVGFHRLYRVLGWLRILSIAAPVVGAGGSIGLFLLALQAEGESFQQLMTGLLLVLAASVIAAAPAGFSRVIFLELCREKASRYRHFRRLVAETFGNHLYTPPYRPADPSESPLRPPVREGEVAAGRRFRSLRPQPEGAAALR